MIKTKLRDYQENAVRAALPYDGFAIFPEPRTGKTLVSLSILDHRKPRAVLVVCPLIAIPEWDQQTDEHLEADWPCTMKIINFEELHNRKKWQTIQKWIKGFGRENIMLIVDESHRVKKRGSKAGRVLRRWAKRYFKYRLILTGTPISQGLQDIWAQFAIVDHKIFGPFNAVFDRETGDLLEMGFADRYLIYGGFKKKQIVGYQNEEELLRRMHLRSYRITLQEARKGNPYRVRHVRRYFGLTKKSRIIYEGFEKELQAVVNDRRIRTPLVLTAAMKCQQVTGGAVLDENKTPVEVGIEKIVELTRLLRNELDGKKSVVICRFSHEIDLVEKTVREMGKTVQVVAGGRKYSRKFDTDVLVLQVASGVAVDMSAASVIVAYSIDWSLLNFGQARFRILDYIKPWITYYYLLAKETIDERVYEAVTRKKDFASLVCDHYRKRGGKRGQSGKAT